MVDHITQNELGHSSVQNGTQSKAQKMRWEKSFWEEQRAFDSQSNLSNDGQEINIDQMSKAQEGSQPTVIQVEQEKTASKPDAYTGATRHSSTLDALMVRSSSSKSLPIINSVSAIQVTQPAVTKAKTNLSPSHQAALNAPSYKANMLLKQSMMHQDGKDASVWFGRWTKGRELEIFNELKSVFSWFGLNLKKFVLRGRDITPFSLHTQSRGDS